MIIKFPPLQLFHAAFDEFVSIHLLEMPGTKRDGKMAVKGVRVYMSPLAAKRLAEVLGEILEERHSTSVEDRNRQ